MRRNDGQISQISIDTGREREREKERERKKEREREREGGTGERDVDFQWEGGFVHRGTRRTNFSSVAPATDENNP